MIRPADRSRCAGPSRALERLPWARGTTLVEGHGYTDPANLSGELPLEQATRAQRTVLGWYLVNDPLFRVTNRYEEQPGGLRATPRAHPDPRRPGEPVRAWYGGRRAGGRAVLGRRQRGPRG